MALAQRLINPPGQHPEEPIGEPATPVSQADAGALSAGKRRGRARQSIGGTTRDTGNVWSLRSSLELGALPTAVSCARLHARHLVWEWGLDGLAETAELLVSELVTNAVQAMVRQENHTAVRLQLFGDNTRVRIEVRDAESRPPAPRDPGQDGIPTSKVREGVGCSW